MPSRRELANAIRALAMDGVQKAKSGHPGMPMGMADIAEVLWNDYLRHNPNNPKWANRDRFVLSNGHGSMLIYALLHLTGYSLPIEELKNFRQLHSKTPGHPEYGYTPGVETTTGPLGQGIANAVGMALAEKILGTQFNRDGHHIIDHYTYVFLGDGCMMEGVSHEACALAGTFKLGKLVAFWDDNGISIDGEVEGWFTDDTAKRFEAYGWHVISNVDGHNPDQIKAAIEEARSIQDKPSLICCKTIIGYGAPNKQGKEECHGAPLGDDEIVLAREVLGWKYPPFEIPPEIYAGWDARAKGAVWEKEWQDKFAAYRTDYPELAAELERRLKGELPQDWSQVAQAYINQVNAKAEKVATRKASQNTLDAYAPHLPELFGGSADLTGSNLTNWKGCKPVNYPGNSHEDGNYIHYGVREFGMAAMMNGIYLHGGFRPFGGTFEIFSDYARNAIRMSALMKLPVIYVLTHDSVGLGEDGPTHQPIEQHGSLRMIPNFHLWRPADAVETAVAWRDAINRMDGPSGLALSRQGLPHLERTPEQIQAISKGGYILRDCDGKPEAIIIATGSEVHLADEAAKLLQAEGRKVRVVSMPCEDVFAAQSSEYQEAVLPSDVTARVAVEAGATDGWYKYVGLNGKVIGLDRFGESAPGDLLMKEFGFTVDRVVQAVREVLTN